MKSSFIRRKREAKCDSAREHFDLNIPFVLN